MYKSIFRRNVYSVVYSAYYSPSYYGYLYFGKDIFKLIIAQEPIKTLSKIHLIETKESEIFVLPTKLKIGDKYKTKNCGDEHCSIVDIVYEDDVVVYILEDEFVKDDYTQETYNKSLKEIEEYNKEQLREEKRKQERKEKVIQEYNSKSWIYRKLHKLEDYLKENKEKWS